VGYLGKIGVNMENQLLGGVSSCN